MAMPSEEATGSDIITRADVESTADSPAALTAGLFFCSLCQSVFKQPKLLPCLHSFCRKCLVGVVVHEAEGSVIRCPSCGYRAPLPPSGIVGVPDNAFLNRICQKYASELHSNLQGSQLPPGGAPAARQPVSRPGQSRRAAGAARPDRPEVSRDYSDDEAEEEESAPKDPFASERSLPDAGDQGDSTLEAIHNRNRLQAKTMCLQGEALRLTYAVDHINSWTEEWQRRREDLKREVRARSSQLQFSVKRAERALLSRIEEESRAAEHRYMRAGEAGKQELRASLRTVLHEVNVIKGLRELATDPEINAMAPHLLGQSVGVAEIALDTPTVALEGGGQKEGDKMNKLIESSLGKLVFSEESTDVFKPEVVDFYQLPVEDFITKAEQLEASQKLAALAGETVSTAPSLSAATDASTTGDTQEESTTSSTPSGSSERRARSKRRHVTDLGLDSPDVRAFLTQVQSARESFMTRRREILQQGQLGRVAATGAAGDAARISRPTGMDAIRARLRSTSRESSTRAPSADTDPGNKGPKQLIRSSSLSRVGSSPSLVAPVTSSSSHASKFLSSSASKGGQNVGRESGEVPHELVSSGIHDIPFLSPQVQRRAAFLAKGRRHSLDTVAQAAINEAAAQISPAEAAQILTAQGNDGGGVGEEGSAGDPWMTSRPLRRAISSGADKRAKIEILRETWQRRKEMLIQSEGFVTGGGASIISGSLRQPQQASPPSGSPRSQQLVESQGNESSAAQTTKQPEVDPDTDLSRGRTRLGNRLAELRARSTRTRQIVQGAQMSQTEAGDGPGTTVETAPSTATSLLAATQLLPDSAQIMAPSFSSLYASRDTVKMAIPEVSEATSPTPDKMRDPSPNPQTSQDTTQLIPSPKVIRTSDPSVELEPNRTGDTQKSQPKSTESEDSETTTTMTSTTFIPIQNTPAPPLPNQGLPLTSITGMRADEEIEQSTRHEDQLPSTSVGAATNAPTFFFRSRLTGKPVGGHRENSVSTNTITTTTSTSAQASSFTPRLADKPEAIDATTVAPTTIKDHSDRTRPSQNLDVDSNDETSATQSVTDTDVTHTLEPEGASAAKDATPLTRTGTGTMIPPNDPLKSTRDFTERETHDSTQSVGSSVSSFTNVEKELSTEAPVNTSADKNAQAEDETDADTETWTTTEEEIVIPVITSINTRNHVDTEDTSSEKPTSPSPSSQVDSQTRLSQAEVTETTSTVTTVTTTTTKPAPMPFFKSRLTGLPVGVAPSSTTASAPTTTVAAPPPMPLFKSRLTGQPVVLGTSRRSSQDSTISSTTTSTTSTSSVMSSRYSTRASTESRYKPSESVDVASLIAAMYSGHERNIIASSTTSEATTITTTKTPRAAVSSPSSTTSSAEGTTGSSYTRRYGMHSTSPVHDATEARSSSQEQPSQLKSSELDSRSTLESRTLSQQEVTTTSLRSSYSYPYSRFSSSPRSRESEEVAKTTLITTDVPDPSLSSSISKQHQLSPVVSRRHTVEVGRSVISDTISSQSEHRHLPDVIPETSTRQLRDEAWTRPEITTDVLETTSHGPGGTAGELLKKAYGLDVDPDISRGVSLTDAIRKSDPNYRDYMSPTSSTARALPEPLDLSGLAHSGPASLASPRSPARSPARSPSALSPTHDPSTQERLKEIARKKKERWRNLTIH